MDCTSVSAFAFLPLGGHFHAFLPFSPKGGKSSNRSYLQPGKNILNEKI